MTMAVAALLSVSAFAQEKVDRVMKITTTEGESESMMLNTVKTISFEEVQPLTMNIEVSNITQNSMDILFEMPEDCKFWLMCIQKEEITGTDAEVRKAIKSKYNDRFDEEKFLRIPNFEEGTTYYIYALLFDKDGVAAGLAKTSATTLAPVQDEFKIDVNSVTMNSNSLI